MDFDITQILSNPAMFVAAIVAIVTLLRKHVIPSADGKVVILVSISVGLAIRFLAPLFPATIINDIVGTILMALTASGSVDFTRGLLDRRSSAVATNNLISSSLIADDIWKSPVGVFVVGVVSKMLPAMLVPIALNILKGVVQEHVTFDLTRDLQIRLTAEVHRVLRGAGLIKQTSIPRNVVSLFALVAILFLSSCDLPAVITPIGNSVTADGATLTYSGTGVTFDPGEVDAEQVVIDIQGDNILTDEASCTDTAFSVSCVSELVTADESWTLTFSCDSCSVFATFFRAGSLEPHSVFPE
jgi:hypothetical protein